MPEKGRATADVLPSPDMAFCQLFRLALQLDGDCLYLGVVLNSIFAHLAAPARLLETAERQRRVADAVAVDPDRRSEERRVGTECGSQDRSGWAPDRNKQQKERRTSKNRQS